ncbi:MAG: putative lipoprotein [Myxococcota bacterium]|jgi:predicted lipoprotein
MGSTQRMPATARVLVAGRRSLAAVAVLALVAGGCGEDSGTAAPDDGFDRAALFTNLSTNVIVPAMETFAGEATTLEAAVSAYRMAPEPGTLLAARDAWRGAMTAWQRVEVMQIGPASAPPAAGAQSLRDAVYSWPTVSPCAVDQQIVSKGYLETDFVGKRLVSVSGLDALEYLLFYAGGDNACASAAAINRDGLWTALDSDDLVVRRATYAHVVAVGIRAAADQLLETWRPAPVGDDFGAQLVSAGTTGSVYNSVNVALDDLFAAIFYVDTYTKDAKLGEVIGQTTECETLACGPERRESKWADHSGENIVANLEALQRLFHGGIPPNDGIGFDDFLVARDGASVSTALAAEIATALEKASNLGASLVSVASSDPPAVEALFTAVGDITDTLRSEFVFVLRVNIPPSGIGDVD